MSAFNRLHELRMDNDQHRYNMDEHRERFAAIAGRHEDGTAPRAVSAYQLFQTPAALAERMASMIPASVETVMDPSAGLGRIWSALERRRSYNHKTLVEINADCASELYRITEGTNTRLMQRDFLTLEPDFKVEAIVMNPPFHMRSDIKHIKHALKFLTDDGVLVAVCMAGSHRERELKPLAHYWEDLPSGTFKSEGTNTDTCLMVIRPKKGGQS